MTDDQQWTAPARVAYDAAHAELLKTLNAHHDLVTARQGYGREMAAYIPSAERLRTALAAFANAEFDWCGSSPYTLPEDEDDDWDDEEDEVEGDVVTVIYRGELHVTDHDALIAAGRSAYRRLWPAERADDAEFAVTDPASALQEVMHDQGFQLLGGLPHVEETSFELHVRNGPDNPDDSDVSIA